MDEDDDILNDDDFDVIDALERTELEYRKFQQRKCNNNSEYTNTNANTTFSEHECLEQPPQQQQQEQQQQQQQQQLISASQPVQYPPTDDTTSNWLSSSLRPPEFYGMPDYAKQKLELGKALQQATRLRSELAFKNQELESTKVELKNVKHKVHQLTPRQESVSMDIDSQRPAISTSTSVSTQSNQDYEQNTQSTSRQSIVFPSLMIRSSKRPRTSLSPPPSPSLGFPSWSSQKVQTSTQQSSAPPPPPPRPAPAPPVKTEAEIKKQLELEHEAFEDAVNKAVADRLGRVKQGIEQQRKVQKVQDGKTFQLCLGSVNFIKSHLNDPTIENLQTAIYNDLRPKQLTTESDSILNALANDLSQCISQVVPIGVKATLSQILFILRIFIQLCVQEDKVMMFIHATEFIYTLATHYQSDIIPQLIQEMLRAGDQSTLHFLTKGLTLIPLKNIDEEYGNGGYIQGFPNISNMDYHTIKTILHGNIIGESDTRRLLTNVGSSQALDTVSMILKLLSGLGINGNELETKSLESTKRLLFLLDQKGFTDLISPHKPLVTTNEALLLIYALVADGNTDWLHVEKYRPLLKKIYSCLTIPRPHGLLELKWYSIRRTVIRLFSEIMVMTPTPFSLELAFNLPLSSSIYILNNECWAIKDGYMAPFGSVPKAESNRLLIDTVSLMHKTLDVYPMLLDYQEGDIYLQILAALKNFEHVMEKSKKLQNQGIGRMMLVKISEQLKQKCTPLLLQSSEA